MPELRRAPLLDSLDEWGKYADKFNHLPRDRQAAFLGEQGFTTLQDLLGHVAGWWEEGQRLVREVMADPAFIYHEPDTDAFNAEWVEKFHSLVDTDALDRFEKTRLAIVDLVKNLPDEALENPLIRDWLYADVIEHLEEHRIPA